jgi:hypothetical protein
MRGLEEKVGLVTGRLKDGVLIIRKLSEYVSRDFIITVNNQFENGHAYVALPTS